MIRLRSLVAGTWLLALAAACGSGAASSPPPLNPRPSDPPAASVPAADAASQDRAFQALAIDLATQTHRVIVGWGTIAFAGTPGRYATLLPTDENQHGAYLIDAGGQRWLVVFMADGRTEPWGADEATETAARADPLQPKAWAWNPRLEHALRHRQTHRGGYEDIEFAVHDGKLVKLASESVLDARDDATPSTSTTPCPGCPVLTKGSSSFEGVHGPARSLAELLAGDH